MTNKKQVDEAAKKRIADVFARMPSGEATTQPPEATPQTPAILSSENAPVTPPRIDVEAQRIVEALRRGGWRGWLIRRLAGL